MPGWGEPRGPYPLAEPPQSVTGTCAQIETARRLLHTWGCVGNNLAEEAIMACKKLDEHARQS